MLALLLVSTTIALADDPWVETRGEKGPGKGKRIVLLSGDEEYRSEEACTQLGRILSVHHGFDCTVLYAIDPKTGAINPDVRDNIPGTEKLAQADLVVMFLRFRNLPDEQMKPIADYLDSGRPIVALRTSTHAFDNPGSKAYSKFGWRSKDWNGGFGRQVLGETWISHHGHHAVEGTRGIFAAGKADHPILRGIADGAVFGPTDVYGVRLPLPGDSDPILLGQVTDSLKPDSKPVSGPKNEPMMPVAWTKSWESASGRKSRIFTTTMGSSQDLENEPFRRLLVNACYWGLAMEEKIDPKSEVGIVGKFEPRPFRFGGAAKGVTPASLRLP
jgi:hypothetical protein